MTHIPTPKELELLAMLAEEASEVVKAATKIMRHGFDSYNPDDPTQLDNTDDLQCEVTDFLAVKQLCREAGIFGHHEEPTNLDLLAVIKRKKRYMHHA